MTFNSPIRVVRQLATKLFSHKIKKGPTSGHTNHNEPNVYYTRIPSQSSSTSQSSSDTYQSSSDTLKPNQFRIFLHAINIFHITHQFFTGIVLDVKIKTNSLTDIRPDDPETQPLLKSYRSQSTLHKANSNHGSDLQYPPEISDIPKPKRSRNPFRKIHQIFTGIVLDIKIKTNTLPVFLPDDLNPDDSETQTTFESYKNQSSLHQVKPYSTSINSEETKINSNRTSIETICVPPVREPNSRVGSGVTDGKLYHDYLSAYIEGLKTAIEEEKKFFFHRIQHSALKRKLKSKKYFESFEDAFFASGGVATYDFESYNTEDFKRIRKYLEIDDDEFKHAFDQAFYDKEIRDYYPVHSANGRYRFRNIHLYQAYYLHHNVHKYRKHLKNHRNSALARYIRLYRVGTSFFTVEHLDYDDTRLENPCTLRKGYDDETFKCYGGASRRSGSAIFTDRISNYPHLNIKEPKLYKKILFDDLAFLKKTFPNYSYCLAVGLKDE